jgi:transposase
VGSVADSSSRRKKKMPTEVAVPEYTTVTVGIGCLLQQIVQRLQVVPILDGVLHRQPNVPTTYGTLAQVILINRLSLDPQPLYALGQWAAEHGIDRLLNLHAEWLDDDRLGALLDGIADHQVTIWSAVLAQAQQHFPMDLAQLHADTTSIYFEGRYEEADGSPKERGARIPRLLKGYNKDGKPHHLQMVLSLITSGHTPLWFCPWNGNQPDNGVYLPDITALRRALLLPENTLLIGDRKLTTEANMQALCRMGQRFLAPHAWNAGIKGAWRKMVARLAAGEGAWQPVAYERRRDVGKPAEQRPVYRVLEAAPVWLEGEGGAAYALRRIWVWSSQQARQDVAHREQALVAGEQELERLARGLGKYRSKRAGVITERIERALRRVHAQEYYAYTLTGSEAKQDWQLSWERRAEVIAEEQRFDGVSLLVTNAPTDALDAPTALIKYKGQAGMEQTIDFLKSPIEIRPLWLHNPRRIAALTLLIMIAVLIAGLIEAQVRRWIRQTGCVIGGLVPEGRDNAYPTARRLLRAFQEYTLVIAHHADGSTCLHYPRLTPVQQQIWEILTLLPLPAQTPLLN